jgi:hypothetical protein
METINNDEIEIDIREYIKILFKYKTLVILCTVLPMVVLFVMSRILPKVYTGTVSLSVLETAVISNDNKLDKMGLPKSFYETLFKEKSFLKLIATKSGIDKNKVKINNLKVEKVDDPKVLKIKYMNEDKEIVDKILRITLDQIFSINKQLKETQNTGTQDKIITQKEEFEKEFLYYENKINEYRKKSDIEILEQILNSKRNTLAQDKIEYEKLENEILMAKENIEEIKKYYKDEKKIETLTRSITEDPAYQQIISKASKKKIEDIIGLKIESEITNPLYQDLKQRLVNSMISLAGAQMRQKIIKEEIEKLNKEVPELQKELIEKQKILNDLQRKYNLAFDRYVEFMKRETIVNAYAPLSVGNISILVPIDISDNPTSVISNKKIIIGGILGFLLSIFSVILYDKLLLL